jgi:YbbR domain-containing protein
MKKGIICILVCTLLIAAILPITAMAGNEQNPMEKSDTEPFQQHQSIENATLEFRFNQRGFTIINIGTSLHWISGGTSQVTADCFG